jgi:hypothetical protein
MISPPAGHETQPAKVLTVSAEGMLPLAVARWVKGKHALAAFVVDDESTPEDLLAALPRFLTDHRVLSVPAWDSLPYDRGRPSRRLTGTRVASLASFVEAYDQPILVLTTPEALPQSVPPAERVLSIFIPPGKATRSAWSWIKDASRPSGCSIRLVSAAHATWARFACFQPARRLRFRARQRLANRRQRQNACCLKGRWPACLISYVGQPLGSCRIRKIKSGRGLAWLGRDSYAAELDVVRAGHRVPPPPDELS